MRIHILGICGTFMGSLAIIARQLGHEVSGSDENVYPPMSTQLEEQGIKLYSGYSAEYFFSPPDLIIVGNTIKRGNPAIEYILNEHLPFISGPQWLAEHVLAKRWVLGVSGTHGKTTTTSMLAWILQFAGKNPGYLVGGVPKNFSASADLGSDPYFVIEADEYDTAFFDKRSKFISYQPRTLIINNIEFDHGDIFPNLAAIQKQFAHLVRTTPQNGLIIFPSNDSNINGAFADGCWTPKETFGSNNSDWQAKDISRACDEFEVYHQDKLMGKVKWQLLGEHNINNALAAIAAANHAKILPEISCEALCQFAGVKRRLDLCGQVNNITIYDDFAHHPTAIAATIKALRNKVGEKRILAIIELASNTMRAGLHHDTFPHAFNEADQVFVLKPKADWDVAGLVNKITKPTVLLESIDEIIAATKKFAKPHDYILIMSNKDFGGLKKKLIQIL